MKILGYIASLFLTLSSVPQVLKTIKQGHSDGLSIGFLLLWLLGNLAMQVYILGTRGWDLPALSSFWASDVALAILLKYKFYPRK